MGGTTDPGTVHFTAKLTVRRDEEYQEIFDQSWRLLSDSFYDCHHHGANWTNPPSLGNKTLRAVGARGFAVTAVGDSGKIWHSLDSGYSWSLQVAPGAPRLDAIAMASDQVGYVVGAGGVILKTVDGGTSWSPLVSGTSANLHAVRFVDASTGWVVGDSNAGICG